MRLATACDEVEHEVAVQGGSGATITRGSASGLGFATVEIQAQTIRDKRLGVKLYLGEAEAEAEVVGDGNRFEIPACPARMRVEPTGTLAYGLGGFIEDIEPKAGTSMKRELVLRPGPDVVRIYGGAFRPGPQAGDDPERPRSFLEPERTVVETFDMDRTEVTARQFMECFGEKRCEPDHGHLGFRSRCVFETEDLQGPEKLQFGRRLIEGKEDLPANCMTIHEAKAYCEWRGMRIPTPVEMEFAARSRKSEYRFPWGNDESECRAFGWDVEVCDKDVKYFPSGRTPGLSHEKSE